MSTLKIVTASFWNKYIYLLSIIGLLFSACHNKDRAATQDLIQQQQQELAKQRAELDSLKNNITNDQHPSLIDAYNKVRKSIVMIVAEGEENVSQGSGIIINADGDAISNFHVFRGSRKAMAIDADGNKYPITKIYRYDEDNDYIFFRIGNGNSEFLPATIATDKVPVGAPCFAVGNPRGLEQTLSNGIVSGYRQNNGEEFIQNTAIVTHGSSGGALFNEQGAVIGITTLALPDESLYFAINIHDLPLSNFKDEIFINSKQKVVNTDNEKAVSTIKRYLLAEESRDFNKIASFYSNNLVRYWDLEYPTYQQLLSRYQHAWSLTENSVNNLKDIEQINDHSFIYTVDFTFYSIKDQVYKTVRYSKVRVDFDEDYKIVSIYGV